MEKERTEFYQKLSQVETDLETTQTELEQLKQEKQAAENQSSTMEGMQNAAQSGSFPSMSGGNSGSAMSGMSTSAGSASAAVSGGTAAVSGGTAQMSMGGQMQSSDSDISLFGDEYDLTEVKNLLEQEASSEDEAEEILEKLLEWQETVAEQYAELIREEEATRLDIQYTYDCAVIEGKQAEITYQEEMESQEETLQAAKDKLTDLEEEKAFLETLTDGIVTAEQGGYVPAVNYEAEDVLYSELALYSIYNMETATVPIEVPQEEIALFAVGDTVDVTISGSKNQEGTISAKAADSTGEGSRTDINYEVEVSIDNSNGRLSAQSAAVITIDGENEEVSGNE